MHFHKRADGGAPDPRAVEPNGGKGRGKEIASDHAADGKDGHIVGDAEIMSVQIFVQAKGKIIGEAENGVGLLPESGEKPVG